VRVRDKSGKNSWGGLNESEGLFSLWRRGEARENFVAMRREKNWGTKILRRETRAATITTSN